MREMSVREANQNFSKLIAAAEQGETTVITKNGRPVARVSPQSIDRSSDPVWREARRALAQSLAAKPATGYRVGQLTEADKYGDDAA